MESVVSSKYKLQQVCLIIAFSLLCFYGGIKILTYGEVLSLKTLFGAVAIFILVVSMNYSFFSHAPKIKLGPDAIITKKFFKSSVYSWDDVTNVDLITMEYYSIFIILGQTLPAMKLVLTNGKSLIFWEDMYRNMEEMRVVVAARLNDKLHFVKKSNERTIYNSIGQKQYAGTPLTSFNSLLIAGMVVFFVITLHGKVNEGILWLLPSGFIVLLYILLGTQMNYFKLQADQLIIKNHYFPWKNTSYALNNIEEVSKESPYRRSDGLRIITYQFESKLYGAGSLRGQNWKELFQDLKTIGIKVS